MAVLIPDRFVYLATPHTASMSTSLAFIQIAEAIYSDVHNDLKGREGPTFTRGTHHATLEKLKQEAPQHFTGNEITVTTVRNPYDLIVTWWLRQRKQLGEKAGREIAFREYVEAADEGTSGGPYIRDGKIFWLKTDRVFRHESLQRDVDLFLREFELPEIVVPRTNVTHDKDPWPSYYDAEIRAIVERKFGEEIEEYEYKFPGA